MSVLVAKATLPILHWYNKARDFTPPADAPLVCVPSVRSLELDQALDRLVDSLLRFAKEQGGVAELFGPNEVDLLEAVRLDLFFSLKLSFRRWWAWQLAAESDLGHAFRIPCSDPPQQDVIALVQQGQALGFEAVLEPIAAIQSSLDVRPVSWRARVQDRLLRLDQKFRQWRPPVAPPVGKGSRRILFADYYSNNIHTLLPIYRALAAREHVDQLYVAVRPPVGRALAQAGVASYDLYRGSSPEIRRADQHTAQILAALEARLAHWWQSGKLAGWLPLGPELRAQVATEVTRSMIRARWLAVRFRHILAQFQPTCVVVSTDFSTDARTLELLAQQRGIQTVSIQHGLFYETIRPAYFLADYICVWGAYHAEFINLPQHSKQEVIVTGSPKHDELVQQYSQSVSPSGRPQIMYVSTPITISPGLSSETYFLTLNEIIKAANEMPEYDFVIKLHPSESGELARQFCAQKSKLGNVRITKVEDAYKLIHQSSVVIVVSSTIGYEALLMHRPVLILNLTRETDWLPFAREGHALGVYEINKLKAVLYQVLSESNGTPSLKRYWLADGRALQRCLSLLMDMD